jgi:queuine tRNA-ribosyltransferase
MVEVFMAGADMMDCVSPTRLARCGQIYSGKLATWTEGSSLKAAFESEFKNGTYLIDKKIWSTDKTTLGHDCGCYTCKCGYTKAYLHHLFKAKELTYYRLATIHNVYTMVQTAKALRRAILG